MYVATDQTWGKPVATIPGMYRNEAGYASIHLEIQADSSIITPGQVSASLLAPPEVRRMAAIHVWDEAVVIRLVDGDAIVLHATDPEVQNTQLCFYGPDGVLQRVVQVSELNPGWVSRGYHFHDLQELDRRLPKWQKRMAQAKPKYRRLSTFWERAGYEAPFVRIEWATAHRIYQAWVTDRWYEREQGAPIVRLDDAERETLRRHQAHVRERLRQKRFDDVALTGYGHLDRYLRLVHEFGLPQMMRELDFYQPDNGVPVFLLQNVALGKVILGAKSTHSLRVLFKDKHLMRLFGFTRQEIEAGFSGRTHEGGTTPIVPRTVGNFLERVTWRQAYGLHRRVIRKLHRRGHIRGGLYAIDTTDIIVNSGRYERCGRVWHYKQKRWVWGYKLAALQNLISGQVICLVIVPINTSDNKLLLHTVRQGVRLLGPGAIKVLLMDKGFYDGADLYALKHTYHIDFLMPGKNNLKFIKELKAKVLDQPQHFKAPQGPGVRRKDKAALRLATFEDVNHMPDVTPVTHYPGRMNVILVTDRENLKKRPRTEEGLKKQQTDIHAYITSLPVRSPYRLYRLYDRRWSIENRVFRELRQNWHLHRLPGWNFQKIRAHLLFTIIAFNLTLLFKRQRGRRYTRMSMATLREEELMALQVVVYVGHEFGTFTIEEYSRLLLHGLAPPHLLPFLQEETT